MHTALSLAESIGDNVRQGVCHLELGQRFYDAGDLDKAAHHFECASIVLQTVDQTYLRARCSFSLGNVASERGCFDAAMQHFHEAADLMEAIECQSGLSHCCTYIGRICRRQGNAKAAIAHLRRAVEGYQQTGFTMDATVALVQLVHAHCEALEVEDARQALYDALAAYDNVNLEWTYGRAQTAFARGNLATADGDFELAEASYGLAISLFWARNCPQELAEVHLKTTALHLVRGKVEVARSDIISGIAIARAGGRPSDLASCVNMFADVLVAQGDDATAFAVSRAILPVLNNLGKMRDVAHCFERFATLASFAGEGGQSRAFLTRALKLYDECCDRDRLQRCGALLELL